MAKHRSIDTLIIDSSVLACNFVNTVSSWKSEAAYDYLATYTDFLDWCAKLEIAVPKKLREMALAHPEKSSAALKRIKEIRAVLHSFISGIAREDEAQTLTHLPAVNLLLAETLSKQRLKLAKGTFVMDREEVQDDFLAPVGKVLQSLTDLLTGHDLKRIKECPACGWVFLDETKNGSRKWCNPKYCGTADKMKRYHQRKRSASAPEDK